MKTLQKHKFLILKVIIILIVIIVGVLVYLKMPDRVAIVRDITTGGVKSYGSKLYAFIRIIGTLFIVSFILYLANKFEFKKPQYKQIKGFQEWLHFVMLLFLAYLSFVLMYITMSGSFNITIPLLWGAGLLLVISGISVRNLKKNELFGLTTPWAVKDESNRKKTHKLGSITFIVLGVIFILSAAFHVYQIYIMEGLLLVAILMPVGYSYWLSRK